MSLQPSHSYADDFYPRGFRKVLSLLIVVGTVIMPALNSWKSGDDRVPLHGVPHGFGGGMPFGGRPGFVQPASSSSRVGHFFLATFGAVVGLMLYYPRRGFKRYALLCGPILGIGATMAISAYLSGRTTVHKIEPLFAALFGAAPGLLVYTVLTRRKHRRVHPPDDDIWITES